MAGEFDELRARLEAISEELADLAIARLRDSIDAGGTELPIDERRLTHAVGRAAHGGASAGRAAETTRAFADQHALRGDRHGLVAERRQPR